MHEVGFHEGQVDENTICNPLSYYGVAKNALRQALTIYFSNRKDVVFHWIRAFYITGSEDKSSSIFSKVLKMDKEGKESFPFVSGTNKYDFIDVLSLAKQIFAVMNQDKITGIINCCSGEPVSLKEKMENFIKENGLKISPEYGAYPSREYDSPAIWGDVTKINKIMNN